MSRAVEFSADGIGQKVQLLTLDGDCDRSAALEAERRILTAIATGRKEIVFDLRGLASVDSSMLQVLFRGLLRSRAEGVQLRLVRPNRFVWTAFEQRGLDRAFATSLDLSGAFSGGLPRDDSTPEPGSLTA